jgi:N-carbamoyl-L-amino-acid hydrolase
VTSIVGIRSFKIRFLGQADHAGTTPMDKRLDAAQGASAFTLAVRELVMKEFPGYVATVGNMEFEPGVFNVVPHTVTVALEFRADDDDKLDEMEAALRQQVSVVAQRFGLESETEFLDSAAPAHMHKQIQKAFANASEALGLKHTFLPSGAGHDAQALAKICPTGMIFVPSVGGFSHSSKEFTEWEDCVNGANTLLHAALILAQ